MQFPPKDDNARREILEFIQKTPFKNEQWSELKSLYKQLEINPIPEFLTAMIHKLDKAEKIDLADKFPTWKTVTYLKRRAARFLRNLASENEELYIRICKDLLLLQKDEINFEWQWVMKQILFGDSKRFDQKRNGRGIIVQKTDLPNINRSEEKFAEIWNKYPAVLELIFSEKGLATEVYEFAAKVFLRNRREIPSLSDAQFDQFFKSDSPFLHFAAAEQGFEKLRLGIPLSDNFKAKIFFFSDEKRRTFILNQLQKTTPEPKKSQSVFGKMMSVFAQKENPETTDITNFVNELANVAFPFLKQKNHLSNRIGKSLDLLFEYRNLMDFQTIYDNANSMILTKKSEWENFLVNAIERTSQHRTVYWLKNLNHLNQNLKNRIFSILWKNFSHLPPQRLEREIQEAFVLSETFLVADFGWFLASKDLNIATKVMHRNVWNLSWQGAKNPAFLHLIKSEFAAKILINNQGYNWFRNLLNGSNLIYVINNGHELLSNQAVHFLKKNAQYNFFNELPIIARLPDLRDKMLAEIEPNLSSKRFIANSLFQCLNSQNQWISENSWRIIESKPPKKEVIQQILLFTIYQNNDSKTADFINRIAAIRNPDFKQNFTLALKNIFQTNPHAINRMANLFDLVMQVIDIESIVNILKAVDDRNWNRIKPSVQTIAEGGNGVLFWLKLLEIIAEEENDSVLANRFLEDDNLSQTFFKIKSPEVLECHHPAFENILAEWLKSNENLFEPNSPELFQAATHRLPKIRNWALEKAQTWGMDVPFAMQLTESGLPETVKIGKQFFENAEAGTTDELENLLALCDSPNSEVRAFGMSFFQSRKANFDNAVALECLSEHVDPIIQEFVAERLGKPNSSSDGKSLDEKKGFVRKFDKAVLRTKNRGRKAKELVKNRIEKDLNVNAATLLELARGHNKKDKEWALEQLTKLALKGEEVPDFQLVS